MRIKSTFRRTGEVVLVLMLHSAINTQTDETHNFKKRTKIQKNEIAGARNHGFSQSSVFQTGGSRP